MKKIMKLVILIISILCIFSLITPKYAFADIDTDSFNPYEIDKNGVDQQTVTKYTNNIYSILYIVAIVVAVIALMILGLKYIVGSATQKADYKKTLVPVIIGICIIVFITTILGIFASFGKSINNSANTVIIANDSDYYIVQFSIKNIRKEKYK